jgi:hypothetical protein
MWGRKHGNGGLKRLQQPRSRSDLLTFDASPKNRAYARFFGAGSPIEFHTEGGYVSGDLDMCLISPGRLDIRTRQELMGRLGGRGGPRSWKVAGQYVDIPGEVETIPDDLPAAGGCPCGPRRWQAIPRRRRRNRVAIPCCSIIRCFCQCPTWITMITCWFSEDSMALTGTAAKCGSVSAFSRQTPPKCPKKNKEVFDSVCEDLCFASNNHAPVSDGIKPAFSRRSRN